MCAIRKMTRIFPLAHKSVTPMCVIGKGRRFFNLAHIPVAQVDVGYQEKDAYFVFGTHISSTRQCVLSVKKTLFPFSTHPDSKSRCEL